MPGTCSRMGLVRLAAWAMTVVAAEAGAEAVAIPGIIQTVGRAEILAAVASPLDQCGPVAG